MKDREGPWIETRAALALTRWDPRTLRARLRAYEATTGLRVLRRWTPRGHWWVNATALAEILEHGSALFDGLEEIRQRQQATEEKVDNLAYTQKKLRRRVSRLESRQHA